MPRLTKDQWSAARIEWESDSSVNDSMLAEKYGISQQAVTKKRIQDGWQRAGIMQNIAQRAQIEADAKLCPPPSEVVKHNQKADVVNAAIGIRAKLLEQHRDDWKEHREQFTLADIAANFELGKSAKITAEMLKIRQEGERKAYGLDEQQPPQAGNTSGEMKVTIVRAKRPDAAEE